MRLHASNHPTDNNLPLSVLPQPPTLADSRNRPGVESAEADDSVAKALADCGLPVQRIGDCASVNYIEGAMHEGHRIGCAL